MMAYPDSFKHKQIQITTIESITPTDDSVFRGLYPYANPGMSAYPRCRISFEDFRRLDSDQIEDNHFFEISYTDWSKLENKNCFENYNIMIANVMEAFIHCMGPSIYPEISKYWFADDGTLDQIDPNAPDESNRYIGLDIPKRTVVVTDNIMPNGHPVEGVHFIPSNVWLQEYDVQTVLARQFDEETIRENIFRPKDKKFIALMGMPKQHRWDFFNKVTGDSVLEKQCLIGSYHPNFKRSVRNDTQLSPRSDGPMYRNMEIDWVQNCHFWISMESWYIGDFDPMSQLTEKTYKPMAAGMPFLISGGGGELDHLTTLGFENFLDVFGDYRGSTFQETNDNIINIASHPEKYDKEELAKRCVHNNKILQQWNSVAVWERYLEEINNLYIDNST